MGVQQSLKERLLIRIRALVATSPADAPFQTSGTIRINLSGDGTKIGKRLHVVNFTFTRAKRHTYEGNHALAIFQVEESYERVTEKGSTGKYVTSL